MSFHDSRQVGGMANGVFSDGGVVVCPVKHHLCVFGGSARWFGRRTWGSRFQKKHRRLGLVLGIFGLGLTHFSGLDFQEVLDFYFLIWAFFRLLYLF